MGKTVSLVCPRDAASSQTNSSICPGRHLADNMVWIGIARLLAVFDIQKAKGADGNVIEPEIEFVTALTRFATLHLASDLRILMQSFPAIPNRSFATYSHDPTRLLSSSGRHMTCTWQMPSVGMYNLEVVSRALGPCLKHQTQGKGALSDVSYCNGPLPGIHIIHIQKQPGFFPQIY